MAMSGAPFAQQYGQAGVQQMGATGVNAQQLQNKTALSNNLSQFPAELKGAGSVPNMVSVSWIFKQSVSIISTFCTQQQKMPCN